MSQPVEAFTEAWPDFPLADRPCPFWGCGHPAAQWHHFRNLPHLFGLPATIPVCQRHAEQLAKNRLDRAAQLLGTPEAQGAGLSQADVAAELVAAAEDIVEAGQRGLVVRVAPAVPFPFLIWSNEHGRWWGANARGYTNIISEAGRYSAKDAERHVLDARRDGPMECNGARVWPEVLVLAPELIMSDPDPSDFRPSAAAALLDPAVPPHWHGHGFGTLPHAHPGGPIAHTHDSPEEH